MERGELPQRSQVIPLTPPPHDLPRVPDPSLTRLLPLGGATLVFEVELLKIERRSEL